MKRVGALPLPKLAGSGYTAPSLRLAVLASGSAGNSIFIEAGGTRLLIDAGLGVAETCRRLARIAGRPRLADVAAVLLTHEHSDHAQGAAPLSGTGLPLFASTGTGRALDLPHQAFPSGGSFSVGSVRIQSVPLPHDAAEPVGFVVEAEGLRAGVLTDLGEVTPPIRDAYGGCDILVLEANHDERLLHAGPYPPFLKRRIRSRLGHLSNGQAAQLLRTLAPRCVLLAHLSIVNNRPHLARAACGAAVGRRGVEIALTHPHRVSSVVTATEASIAVEPARSGEQLPLFAQVQA